ncbi:HEAT repeat domain-containing protein [Novipirellula artificiosorum]|uniref:HEAT repeat domain-containing protein n=1 Tax=Novipirellula artificiosorum TaxID=2528016 RepID=UPI0011B56BDD|nr:hypothetical protein [Novipirellula artificiosorum]
MLQHHDRLVRRSAIALLTAMGAKDPESIKALHRILSQNNPQLAVEAAIGIVKLKPDEADDLFPFLKEQLASHNPMIIRLITNSIEFLGDKTVEFLDQLMDLLDYETVAENAALAILRITGDDKHARQIADRWRRSDDVVQNIAASELEQEIDGILVGWV